MTSVLVERVWELPYLVLVEVFERLPMDTAWLYRRCPDRALRELVRARRWRHVVVREGKSDAISIRSQLFQQHVDEEVAPPCHIGCITIPADYGTLPIVVGWSDYLAHHADTVTLEVTGAHGSGESPVVLSRLSNLTRLQFGSGLAFGMPIVTLAGMPLPEGLRVLLIDELIMGLSELVIPASVTELAIQPQWSDWEGLPVLPPGLESLTVTVPVVDVGPLLPLLPRGLRRLQVVREGARPAAVLRAVLEEWFGHGLEHNVGVYDDASCAGYTTERDGRWVLVVDCFTDYTRYVPPQEIERLVVESEDYVVPGDVLTHVLPQLPRLRTLEMANVGISPCPLLPRHVPSLREVLLVSCRGVSRCDWRFLTKVLRLRIKNCGLDEPPAFVSKCFRLEELDLSANDFRISTIDGALLPRSLRRLNISDNAVMECWRVHVRERALSLSYTVSLLHLRLGFLDLLNGRVSRLEMILLPSSVRELRLRGNTLRGTEFGEVRLPLSLEVLDMSECDIAAPWALQLPKRLRVLDLLGNPMMDPPTRYTFPPLLCELGMRACWTLDLRMYVFPEGLRRVDLRETSIERGCAWPAGCEALLPGGETDAEERLGEHFRSVALA